MDIHDLPEISEMMTSQSASTRSTWRNMNHADGEIPTGANRQTLSGKIPNGANRQSTIGGLAEKFSLAANRSTSSNDLEIRPDHYSM